MKYHFNMRQIALAILAALLISSAQPAQPAAAIIRKQPKPCHVQWPPVGPKCKRF